MAKCLIIKSNGEKSEELFPEVYVGGSIQREQLQRIVNGDIEYVTVLYKGERTYMVVNEIGSIEPRLPVNKEATEIYWENSHRREGRSMKDFWNDEFMPLIHGDVAILEGVHVK